MNLTSPNIPAERDEGSPREALERFAAALQALLRTNCRPSAFDSNLWTELRRIVGTGIQQLGDELQREAEILNAMVAQMNSLSKLRLLDHGRISAVVHAEIEPLQLAAANLLNAIRGFDLIDQPAIESKAWLPEAIASSEPKPIENILQFWREPLAPKESPPVASKPARDPHVDSVYSFHPELSRSSDSRIDCLSTSERTIVHAHKDAAPTALDCCKQADAFRRRRDYVSAEELYSEAIAHDPQFQTAFAKRGLVYLLAGENGYAIDDFDVAIELNRNDSETISLRGDAHARLGDLDRAIADYRDALKLQSDLHRTRLNLGIALRRLERWAEAKAELTAVLQALPDHAAALLHRGCAHLELAEVPEAIADFESALRFNPELVEAQEKLRTARQRDQARLVESPKPKKVPASVEAPNRISVKCPGCGAMGLFDWSRMDKIVMCKHCKRSFSFRPDGTEVEVIRASDGRWVDLQAAVAKQKLENRRQWLKRSAFAALALPIIGFSAWRVAKPSKQLAANELPKDLKPRADLFTRAWLRNDVPLMRRLTSPTHERTLYGWYDKNRPTITRTEGIRAVLPDQIKLEITVKPDQEGWSKVTVHIDGLGELGGKKPSVDLIMYWQEAGDTWFFQPPTR